MARPNWEYIRVDVRFPRHRKLDGATRQVRWTIVELWAYCGEELTDGFVRDAVWKTIGTPALRQQVIDRGFASRVRGGYQMHAYLEHQRSRAEVEELRRKRSAAGRKGGLAKPSAKQTLKQELKQNGSKTEAEAEAEAEAEVDPPVAEAVNSNVEAGYPQAVTLPAGKWMNGAGAELPPPKPDEEKERRRQMDALMREYPEVAQ